MMKYLLRRAAWALLVGAFALLADYARAGTAFALSAPLAVPSSSGWTISSMAADAGFAQMMQRTLGPAAGGATEFSTLMARPFTGMATSSFEATMTRSIASTALADAALPLGIAFAGGFVAGAVIYDAVTGERYYADMVDGWVKDMGTLPVDDPDALAPARWCAQVGAGHNTTGNACAAGPNGSSPQAAGEAEMRRVIGAYNTANPATPQRTARSFAGITGTSMFDFNDVLVTGNVTWTLNNSGSCGEPSSGLPACTTTPIVDSMAARVFAYCQNGAAPTNQGGVAMCKGTSGCPASIDALNPALNVAAGAPPMADGKCRTGRYNKVPANDPAFKDMGSRLFRQAVGQAVAETILNTPGAKLPTGPGTLSGPASLDGPTTVRTEPYPGGGNRTITEHDEWKLGYLTPDAITKTPKRTTTNCPPTGPCETTTEETPPPVGGVGGETPDYCIEHPERVGCQELEDPGDERPEWSVKDVPFSIEDLGLPSGCPPDRMIGTLHTWDLWVRWEPVCNVAPVARPGVIALAALGALLFVVANIKA